MEQLPPQEWEDAFEYESSQEVRTLDITLPVHLWAALARDAYKANSDFSTEISGIIFDRYEL